MLEYILSMICKSHLPSVNEKGLSDVQVYKGLTDEYDLVYPDIEGVLPWRRFREQ